MNYDTLLASGLVDHIGIARKKARIDSKTPIDLRYYSEDEDVRRELSDLFSPAYKNPVRVVSAHETSPNLQSEVGWAFSLDGRDITIWVTEYER